MAQVSLDFVCRAKYEVNLPAATFISRYSRPGLVVSPFATAFMLTCADLVLHAVSAYTADVGWSAKLNIRRSKMKTHSILFDHNMIRKKLLNTSFLFMLLSLNAKI